MLKKGFTLIELLIVVAIIAILAAIAVPNFLEAQVRSKVSRAKSDLRTLATAIESYAVDHNKPPVDYDVDFDPEIPEMGILASKFTSGIPHPGYRDNAGNVHPGLTTPIAYVTNCWIRDPFVASQETFATINTDEQIFTYNWIIPAEGTQHGRTRTSGHYTILRNNFDYYGYWRLGSIGPDRTWYNGGSTSIHGSRIYDPTNGTVSKGNIWRSQKEAAVNSRPLLDWQGDPNG